jgi:hypothetical protein
MNARAALPWAALAVVVVVALALRHKAPEAAQPGDTPSRAAAPASLAPTMTPAETRDFRVHIGHEECELGVSHINEVEGRDRFATNPKILNELSICLRIGNLAWSKCIAASTSGEQARSCNVRFLNLDHPPS